MVFFGISTNLFADLLISLISNYSSLLKLYKKPELKIDNLGSSRIVNELFNYKNGNKKNKIIIDDRNTNIKKLNYRVRDVNILDINHYLFCRNKKINKLVSSSKKDISNIEHYNWWFNNKRKSYILKKNHIKLLYFYEQEIVISKTKYFVSGFFVNDKCKFHDVVFALNWQKKQSKPKDKWVQFIHKKNIVFNKISNKLGWKLIDKDDYISKSIVNKYKLNENSYFFYIR